MSLTQGEALPNIDTSKTTKTEAPDFYNTYLTDIAKVGTDAIARTAEQNVAGLTDAQKNAIRAGSNITAGESNLTGAQTSLTSAGALSAATAANPYLTSGTKDSYSNIDKYLDPYRTQVVDEIGRLGMENLNQVLLPQQTGRSVGFGDFGSSRAGRAYGATAQGGLRDILGAQSTSLSAGYKSALDAASRDLQREIEAAKITGDTTAADAANRRLEALAGKDIGMAAFDRELREQEQQYKMGERERSYNQDIMNEPLITAKNAAGLLENLKVPTTVTEEASAPIPGAYSNSTLSNILGVGSLFASGRGGVSAVDSVLKTVLGNEGYNSLKAVGALPSIIRAISRGQVSSGGISGDTGESTDSQSYEDWYNSLTPGERDYLNTIDADASEPITTVDDSDGDAVSILG
jgi:hypothetical protein